MENTISAGKPSLDNSRMLGSPKPLCNKPEFSVLSPKRRCVNNFATIKPEFNNITIDIEVIDKNSSPIKFH